MPAHHVFIAASAASLALGLLWLRRRSGTDSSRKLRVHSYRRPGVAIDGMLLPQVALTVGDEAPATTEVLLCVSRRFRPTVLSW
jgi:hypothetical protein